MDGVIIAVEVRFPRGETLSRREARSLVEALLPTDIGPWEGPPLRRFEVANPRALRELYESVGLGGQIGNHPENTDGPCRGLETDDTFAMPIQVAYGLDRRGNISGFVSMATFVNF